MRWFFGHDHTGSFIRRQLCCGFYHARRASSKRGTALSPENKKIEREFGWRWPTLACSGPHTTMGAGGLNCRVRDGTGWTPAALITNRTLVLTVLGVTLPCGLGSPWQLPAAPLPVWPCRRGWCELALYRPFSVPARTLKTG